MQPMNIEAEPRNHDRSFERRARYAEVLFDGIDDEVFVHDLEGRILDANAAACRRLGYSRDELLRMTTRDIDDPDFASGFEDRLAEQMAQGRLSCEGSHVTKDGKKIPVDINTSMINIDGKPAVLAVMRDITARKTAERRLAAQYAVTRALAESTTLEDAAPTILQAVCTCMGWDLGSLWRLESGENVMRCVDVWHSGSLDAASLAHASRGLAFPQGQGMPGKVWETGKPHWVPDIEQIHQAPRASYAVKAGLRAMVGFPIRAGSDTVGVLEFFHRQMQKPDEDFLSMIGALGSQIGQFLARKLAEETQQRMQTRLIQSEKLASIGLLSAGVAHEINNPLAYVANNLVVLERDMKGARDLLAIYDDARPKLAQVDPETAKRAEELADQIDLPYIRDNLDRILSRTREGVERMAKIVQGLRGLARTDRPQLEEVHLPDLVESSLEMIRGRLQRRGIQVERNYQQVSRIRCVSTQISQVLLNMFVNATQAIESRGGPEPGRIVVSVSMQGSELLLEVSDNGCGMDSKDIPRIFDPFYTSKPVGEGTGLGLSICHGIVTGHGGRIEVESRPGEGTRFRVFLPLDHTRGRS